MILGRKPEGIGGELKKILKEMEKANPDIIGALIVRTDGLLLASSMRGDIDADLAAAMVVSVLGISGRVTKEINLGDVEDIVIKSKEGNLAVIPIDNETVLGAITRSNANLGLLLLTMRKTRDKLLKVLEKF